MTNQEFIESIRLEGEEWRDVVGLEGLYAISSFGRVACLKEGTHKRLIMKPVYRTVRKQVYNKLQLWRDGKRVLKAVHRMVAEAFIPNPNNYPCIDHIDGNGINNNVSNLRWCTRSSNNHNPISRHRQSLSHKGKIIESTRKKVIQLSDVGIIKVYDCITDVTKDGFIRSCVSRVCNGSLSQHKGFRWMYLSDYESLVSMSKNELPNPDNDYPQ